MEKIIADVSVRRAVAVEIAKYHREDPILWRSLQRLTRFIKKGTTGPGDWREAALAIVYIEEVSFAQFDDFDSTLAKRHRDESPGGRNYDLAINLLGPYFKARRTVPISIRAVIGDVRSRSPSPSISSSAIEVLPNRCTNRVPVTSVK